MVQVMVKTAILIVLVLLLVKSKAVRENTAERSVLLWLIAGNIVSFLPLKSVWMGLTLSFGLYFVLYFVMKSKMKKQ